MKQTFVTNAKITRTIDVTPTDYEGFVMYEDKIITSVDGCTLNKINIAKGITSYENVQKAKYTLDSIGQKIPVKRMYCGSGFVARIENEDLKKVRAGKMHILDAVVDATGDEKDNITLDGYTPIIWNPGSYKAMTLDYKFISIPIKLNDSMGCVTNEYYDLEKLLEVLKKDERVLDRENLEIKEIPYYNRTQESWLYIEFQYLLSDEDYDAMAEQSGFEMQQEVLNRVAKDCRKEEEKEED